MKALVAAIIILALPTPASAQLGTCGDSSGVWTCCDHWVVDETRDETGPHVVISEASFDRASAAVTSRRATLDMLCKYWKGSDCAAQLGEPRCAGSRPLRADVCAGVKPWLSDDVDGRAAKLGQRYQAYGNGLGALVIGAHVWHPARTVIAGKLPGPATLTAFAAQYDGIQRALAFKDRIKRQGAWNPYMDCLDKALASPERLFDGTGQFGGHDEALVDAREHAEQLDGAWVALSPAPYLPDSTHGPATLKSLEQVGEGRLIFGAQGPARDGAQLPAGDVVVAFATLGSDGEPVFWPVTITPSGATTMRITGEHDGAREVVEVTAISSKVAPSTPALVPGTPPVAPMPGATPPQSRAHPPIGRCLDPDGIGFYNCRHLHPGDDGTGIASASQFCRTSAETADELDDRCRKAGTGTRAMAFHEGEQPGAPQALALYHSPSGEPLACACVP